jgi:transcriptional regulator with XRE-family HTH domain
VAAIRMGQRLDRVRTGRGMTQTEVARRMGVSQSHVAQVEARDDVYLSTLISYVRALGGDLRIEAVFPGEEPVAITLGAASDEQKSEAASALA